MKIKHFMGYGSVNATKLSKKTVTNFCGEKYTQLSVRVTGNHEWGLRRDNTYDLYNWLIKRFDKTVGDYYTLNINYQVKESYIGDTECCEYTFIY